MAPRRSAVAVEVEEEAPLPGLNFNEPLSWRAGKAIPTNELLRRLDVLAKELRDMDQEESDKSSLTKVAKELAGPNLLSHKDRGVRAFTACCLVDVLKICAPDAPFTPSQLRDIFTLFVTSILPALSDPSNAYNAQHVYVLTSLAEVKSIVLLTDVNESEALILHLFTSFFDIVSGTSKTSTGEQLSKNVEYHMNQILVTLVDEAPSLPTEVIDIIVAQFLRAASSATGKTKHNGEKQDDKQSTLMVKEVPAAYRMAEYLCNACSDKMSRYISQYFNDVIVDASTSAGASKPHDHRRSSITVESDDEDANLGPTEADLKELTKAHRLLRELWRASPLVLQNVIPQLEAELSAENVQLRLIATETLGDINSGIGAAGPPPPPVMDPAAYPPLTLKGSLQPTLYSSILITPMSPQSFPQSHPSVYQSFLSRRNDKSALIRSAWTTAIGRILSTNAGSIGLSREDETELVIALAEKLTDADERVRLAAVKAVAGFGFRDVMTKLAPNGDVGKPGSVLCNLADRARDRKHAVRVEGMTTISKIWGVAAGEIAAGNETVIASLGGIPSKIFEVFYANDPDVNVLLDHVMFEQLLPLSFPPTKVKGKAANGESQGLSHATDESFDPDKIRTERLLILVRSLEPKSKKAFFAMHARQTVFYKVMTQFLAKCEEYNGGVVDGNEKEIKEKLAAFIKWFTALLPDPPRTTADLWKFVKMHDRRTYHLIRCTMDPKSDFKTVYKAIKEFSKRVEAAPGAPAGLLDTMLPLLYRAGSIVYNQSQLPAILAYSRNDEQGLSATAHEVLKEISEKNPDVFKAQVKNLCKQLEEQAPSKTQPNDIGSVKTLKACAGFARKYPKEIPKDRKFVQALLDFAKYGAPPKAAKHAITILMYTADRKEMHAKDLAQFAIKNWEYASDHYLTKLAALSQLNLLAPTVMDEFNDDVLDITTQKVLLENRTPANVTDRSWQDDSALDDECQAKCWSLKCLVNRLRALTDPEQAKVLAEPVFKLLNALVFKEGELSKGESTPKHHRSRLRLLAAQLLLKLCTIHMFEGMLKPDHFNRLATVAQDGTFQVRRRFIEKLQKYLVSGRLGSRFYAIIFLVAFEPDLNFRNMTVTWIRSRARVFQEKKATTLEAIFPRLLSLLAHHPDYSPEADDLVDTAQYIIFYISTVANEENLGLIYKYAERVKQARDALNPVESDNLYVLSDLAQAMLRKWEIKKGWNMQTYPGKVGLTKDLFGPMPDHATAQETADKNYLPDEMDERLDAVIKTADKKRAKRKSDDDGEKPAAKKPRQSTVKATPKTPAVKKIAKPKTPKTIKKKIELPSSAVTDSARRRSGRAAASKSYADRDSSEDEQEMMEGVSKWEYDDGRVVGGDGEEEDDDEVEEEDQEEDVEMSEAEIEAPEEPEPEKEPTAEPEPESEPAAEEEREAEESSSEPTPPPTKASGRGRGRSKKAVPVRPKKAAPVKAKVKAAVEASPAKSSPARRTTRNKGKGKATEKDVFDIEESE